MGNKISKCLSEEEINGKQIWKIPVSEFFWETLYIKFILICIYTIYIHRGFDWLIVRAG